MSSFTRMSKNFFTLRFVISTAATDWNLAAIGG
jgi:hypothetical protein